MFAIYIWTNWLQCWCSHSTLSYYNATPMLPACSIHKMRSFVFPWMHAVTPFSINLALMACTVVKLFSHPEETRKCDNRHAGWQTGNRNISTVILYICSFAKVLNLLHLRPTSLHQSALTLVARVRPAASAQLHRYVSSRMRLLHGDLLLILQPYMCSINAFHFCSSSLNISSVRSSEGGVDATQLHFAVKDISY